jgi:mycothiol synthase
MVSPGFLAERPDWLDVLIQRATRADAQPPFSDGSLVALATGSRRVLAIGDVAAALVGEGEAEFVVDPDARRHRHGTQLIEALLERDPELKVWAHGDHPAARRLAVTHGLVPVRELLQLRATGFDTRPPSSAAARPATADRWSSSGRAPASPRIGTPFDAARDAADWLDLNSRAFASHPEQGRVTRADLDVLMAEPWFDPADLLLLRDDDGLVGYCWLKVEHGIGEFYVVGVSPERQGEGLGRRLVEAGLSRLAARGIRTASLYVEADNVPAVRLYRSFGFVDHSIDIQYARE